MTAQALVFLDLLFLILKGALVLILELLKSLSFD